MGGEREKHKIFERNSGLNLLKFYENYKPTNPGSLTKLKHKKTGKKKYPTPRHIIITLLKTSDKERILKQLTEKGHT